MSEEKEEVKKRRSTTKGVDNSIEKEAKSYRCITACFYQDTLYQVGDVIEFTSSPPEHFVEI